jgi:signal transduction histidine kinase
MNSGNLIRPIDKPFRGFSIQKRLPLLICVLLLSIVVALGIASYIGVKRASLKIAGERLHTVTEQLSSLFGQSAQVAMLSARNVAHEEPVRKFLQSDGTIPDSAAKASIQKLQTDTQSLYVELLDNAKKRLLRAGRQGMEVRVDSDSMLSDLQVGPDSAKVGKMYRVGDSLYYAIVATVTDNKQTIGYLIRWRLVFATAQGMQQFSQLLGTNAAIYIGNRDGMIWSDLMKPVIPPPVNVDDTSTYFSYSRQKAGSVIAMARPVANTQWTLLLEFSQKKILEGARQFAGWILIIGGIITITGIIIAWIMSRNITLPLKRLTAAATAVADGDYTTSVEVQRRDELGELARSFNSMAAQIKNSQQNLEQKVKDRTAQLEAVNKELEAFSYSVSHDLRAPLRAIGGYAKILKEDYGEKLDAEADRLTSTIISKAKIMGQLIDDLIMFSKMGRKEITSNKVNMKELAESCMNELLQQEPEGKYHVRIHSLPDCRGEQNLLKQVWVNLIGNAIKYSSTKNNSCIEIGFADNADMCTYFVKDNGVGFDMQYAHKLFGVFERLHDQETFQGTGIGLALVKRVIDRHKGKVWAEASPGDGATFYFSIPKSN